MPWSSEPHLFFSRIPIHGLLCHPGSIRAAVGQPEQQVACPITSNSLPFMHLLARVPTNSWPHQLGITEAVACSRQDLLASDLS